MLNIKTLGIFDSGLGGYSVYHDLKSQFPKLNMVMFADQANAPYGNRTDAEIQAIAHKAISGFQARGIDSVLIACNTVSGIALDFLRAQFPTMNLWGIIDLTVSQVNENQSVKVVATQATVNSKSYEKALPRNQVKACSLPNLVGLIEGLADEASILNEIKQCDYSEDVLILGCTHYPLVRSAFESCTKAIILDSFGPIRAFVEKLYVPQSGMSRVYTSGDVQVLEKQIQTLFSSEEAVLSWNSSF